MQIKIGLAGSARHGKDTTAKYLVDNYGFQSFAFATPLKELAKRLFGFTDEQLYGNDRDVIDSRALDSTFWHIFVEGNITGHFNYITKLFNNKVTTKAILTKLDEVVQRLEDEKLKFSARIVLQYLGTEFGRALYSEVWTEAAILQAANAERAVFTDCRFLNEAKVIDGVIWWVDASKRLNTKVNPHASEPTIELFKDFSPILIDNNHTINDLYANVTSALSYVLPPSVPVETAIQP